MNSLRAQLGREIAKVNKTKSGQATNELCQSNWVYWEVDQIEEDDLLQYEDTPRPKPKALRKALKVGLKEKSY